MIYFSHYGPFHALKLSLKTPDFIVRIVLVHLLGLNTGSRKCSISSDNTNLIINLNGTKQINLVQKWFRALLETHFCMDFGED